MTLYHTTTPESAAAIQRDGFDDRSTDRFAGKLLRGIFLSNEPLWENELIDPVTFEIDLSLESVAPYECTTPEHGYRQWIVPSNLVNQADRRLVARATLGGRRHAGLS